MSKTASAAPLAPVKAVPHSGSVRSTRFSPRVSSAELRLLARLRAGEESALVELVHRYHGPLLRLALALLPNEALAEEAVQDTWTAVVDGLASFEGRSSLKTWIFRILANRAKTRMIREARSVPFSALRSSDSEEPAVDPGRFCQDGTWAEPPRSWEDSPEKLLMDKDAVGCLERALRQLPPNQRAVVTLRDVQGLESDEVCNILGVRETNQRVLLHRARSKLRRALEEHVIGA